MLVNLEEILKIAEENDYALAAFTTPTFENVVSALNMAEKYNVPIILQHAEVHESIISIDKIGPVLVSLAEKASVPVCVQIDHGESFEFIKKGLELGFTSIMYDGSTLPYEENIKNTKKVVELASHYGASVEAELGIMAGDEGSTENNLEINTEFYTDPELAAEFVEKTGITALAAVFGTAHGFYSSEPNLDFQRISDIRKETGIPVVMHGGSGLSTLEYQKAIENGVRKINYYSYSAKAAMDATKKLIDEESPVLFDQVVVAAINAIEKDYEEVMKTFYSLK